MKFVAHDYQKFVIDYIVEHPIAAVILQMGLGKTVCTLSAIDRLLKMGEVKKVLIIAPLRVAKVTWPDEIQKWDELRHLKYSLVAGTRKERVDALKKEAVIYIINRENLDWLVELKGHKFDYDMVVIDELSSFKNWSSKRFKAFMRVRPFVKRVVGLTGSPCGGSYESLYGEYKCLDMGERLGRYIGAFRRKYFEPAWQCGNVVYKYNLLPGADKAIQKKIADITISMKSIDHIKMPDLFVNDYKVYMSKKEEELYKDLKRHMIVSIDEEAVTAVNAASLSNKLCQMANGTIYSEDKSVINIHNRKLDALEDIIEAADGPLLVAYWYKHDKQKIISKLEELKVNFRVIESEEDIRSWNKNEIAVGLIHPLSCGHGLNLQGAGDTIVWYSIPWSLEAYEQTVARLYRQGQKSSKVVVIHLVTAGTIDEQIVKSLNDKSMDQNSLIDAVKASL